MDTTIPFPATIETEAVSGRERIDALFDAHRHRLFALALRMTGHRADALDLVQETFLRALAHVGSVPETGRGAEAWLVRVLVNLVRDRGRRRKVRGVPGELSPTLTASPAPEAASVARIHVRRALQEIAPRRRAILLMSDVEGMTSVEIAHLLGLRPATVRWHLSRARAALRTRLAGVHVPAGGDA